MPSDLAAILRNDSKRLQAALGLDADGARIEMQCLLQAVLQVNRAYLLTHPEQLLNSEQQARYAALFERRLRGEPIAYILGEREFYGLNFKVTPATLIPRADTELLVELALQRIPERSHTHGISNLSPAIPLSCEEAAPTPPLKRGKQTIRAADARIRESREGLGYRVLDLGTGSGAIALSIAHARPDADVTAVDASSEALEVAGENVWRLALGNVRLLRGDWFSALQDERFDLIVSNPPYIAAGDTHLAQGDLHFEPRGALVSGMDGLGDIRRIVTGAKAHLNDGGWLLLEHGYDQAGRVRALLQQSGLNEVFSARDLAGIERVTGGRSGRRIVARAA